MANSFELNESFVPNNLIMIHLGGRTIEMSVVRKTPEAEEGMKVLSFVRDDKIGG